MENLVMINNKFWDNKKVLVTGHTGFKGAWLLIWLLEMGAKVYGYSLKAEQDSLFKNIYPSIKNNFVHKEANILELDNLKNFISNHNPDIIFHLAAQPLVSAGYKNPILTWETNVIGSLNLLEASKNIRTKCSIVMITTDKVYENKELKEGYSEEDLIGGYDPYSSSKAGAEIAIKSWRSSFCNLENNFKLNISTARAGNVIGGGDFAKDRLIPDIVKALKIKKKIIIRNPESIRPWQHVLEPLNGYLLLAEKLYKNKSAKDLDTFNFGPNISNNKTVEELVETALKYWEGEWEVSKQKSMMHETKKLHLKSDKARSILNFYPKWGFEKTIAKTINWYKNNTINAYKKCLLDIREYTA